MELSPAVDVPVTVNTEWTGPDGFMITNTAQPDIGSTATYISTLTLPSFGRNQSENYTCSVRVSSTLASLFLNDSLPQSDIKRITTGKTFS